MHRWLFEDSDNGKVPLRPLMHDLCQSIAHAIHDRYDSDFSITQDVAPLHVAQDHAVSLAFLVTEIAASAVENQPPAPVAITLWITRRDGQGRLVMTTERFRGDCALAPDQMTAAARIANGMARQLRTQLQHDGELGEYSLVFTRI